MSNLVHLGLVLEISTNAYQACCTCGWCSSIAFYEEADLLKAMHIHEYAVFSN
jgi:hypothetical protein